MPKVNSTDLNFNMYVTDLIVDDAHRAKIRHDYSSSNALIFFISCLILASVINFFWVIFVDNNLARILARSLALFLNLFPV